MEKRYVRPMEISLQGAFRSEPFHCTGSSLGVSQESACMMRLSISSA